MTNEERQARWEGASDDEKAFVHFLYNLTGIKTIEDVVASAGALLQDLGWEPS